MWQDKCQQLPDTHDLTLQVEYLIRVQLLEIYNEQLRDLLDERRTPKKLNIQNTERSGLNVPDAIQVRLWDITNLCVFNADRHDDAPLDAV